MRENEFGLSVPSVPSVVDHLLLFWFPPCRRSPKSSRDGRPFMRRRKSRRALPSRAKEMEEDPGMHTHHDLRVPLTTKLGVGNGLPFMSAPPSLKIMTFDAETSVL